MIKLSLATALAVSVMILVSCGGGGSGVTPAISEHTTKPPATDFEPEERVGDVSAASLADNEPTNSEPGSDVGFVGGVNLLEAAEYFKSNLHGSHGRAKVGHLRIRDGISASELLRYLRADAGDKGRVLRWGDTPPTVRMAEGSTWKDVSDTLNAVRIINSALPPDWQLRFDDTRAARAERPNPGYIDVAFVPREDWPAGPGCSRAIGCAEWTNTQAGRVTAATVVVDPIRVTGERRRVQILLHELLHALGRGHVDPNVIPNTIMTASGDRGKSDFLILSRLDEAALHAIYDRLTPGMSADLDANDLGPWNDVSTHVFGGLRHGPGQNDAVGFGAVWQNGLVRPYAIAMSPTALNSSSTVSANMRRLRSNKNNGLGVDQCDCSLKCSGKS